MFDGDVQGVGFRSSVCRIATKEEATGFVMNLENGNVLLEIQGYSKCLANVWNEMRRQLFSKLDKKPFIKKIAISKWERSFNQRGSAMKPKYSHVSSMQSGLYSEWLKRQKGKSNDTTSNKIDYNDKKPNQQRYLWPGD